MEKQIPNKLFFKIGEVCEITDTQPYVLRYWESEFAALAPAKNSSGQRIYRRKDIETVLRIKQLLYEEGFTIAGAKKRLEAEVAAGGPKTRSLHAVPEPGAGERAAEPVAEGGEPEEAASRRRAPKASAPAARAATAQSEDHLRRGLAKALRQAREILALLGPASSPH
jgi:DNA-binding transcriptional MerR regulator